MPNIQPRKDTRTYLAALDVVLDAYTVLSAFEHSNHLERLAACTDIDNNIRKIQREMVHSARAAGRSWDEIGKALGISRQAAWERYSIETG